MVSLSAPTPHKLCFSSPKSPSPSATLLKRPSCASPSLPFHFLSQSNQLQTICRCQDSNSASPSDPHSLWRWDSALLEFVNKVIQRFDSYVNPRKNDPRDALNRRGVWQREAEIGECANDGGDDPDWDWDRWRKHFDEVDERERLVAILKSRLNHAVYAEDYDEAARLKVAIAAAATNDTVGRVMSHLNRAIEEELYQDAAFMRDHAGAGMVGWWAGTSKNGKDPHGIIIRITAEHGRYVARSYSPRQLASAGAGVPLFEIFLRVNKKGEYKQQAVYLKRRGLFQDPSIVSSKKADNPSFLNTLNPSEDKGDLLIESEDAKDGDDRADDSDIALGRPDFQNFLKDMIPGVKVKVLKVTVPEKIDKDLISKVIEQIIDEEEEDDEEREDEEGEVGVEEEKDGDLESVEAEDGIRGLVQDRDDDIELNADPIIDNKERRNEIAIKVVVGGLAQKLSSSVPSKDLLRVPAKIAKKGRLSFSFSIEKDVYQSDKKAKFRSQSSIDQGMLDLANFVGREKIPLKVLKDVGELINLTLNQAKDYQPLSGSTIFNRIEIPTPSDPLNGLYIGAHGLYTYEVIHLRRRFGQWQEDGGSKEPANLEFYEYVEALKITGDPYVPAGQVAFRAKVGKRYQLPHKGIIPEEFGVIARYKGQGRLAEPGFRNPRWVDGELVILDGKYIKGGPVVGFVYWAPEFHFLVFFNRLRLPD